MADIEILCEGLEFPEGPMPLPDGSVILVEIKRQTLTRVWNGKRETIAPIPGGPNGAAFGPDGAVYICNNGGFAWHERAGLTIPGHAAKDYAGGRIERVDLATGKLERLYDKMGEHALSGPNDIVFDKAGGFWFTDLGKNYRRSMDRGGLYYARPDGALIIEAAYGGTGLNGVGLSPDERVVYAAETETGRLWAFDITAQGALAPGPPGALGRFIGAYPGHALFDSLAVEAGGAICVATLLQGGISRFTPEGAFAHTPLPDPLATNIAFAGADMRDAYVTLSGTGKLARLRWPAPGLRLNFAPY